MPRAKSEKKCALDEPPPTFDNLDEFLCPCKIDKGEKLYELLRSWFDNPVQIDPKLEWEALPPTTKVAFVMAANSRFR